MTAKPKYGYRRQFLEQCAKDGMTVAEVVAQFGFAVATVYKLAGDLFADQRQRDRELAMASAVEAYKQGAPVTAAARAAGLYTKTLVARLRELGIAYERRYSGPTSGPRFAGSEAVMSDKRGERYKRLRDLLLAGKTQGEAAREVGVTRAMASLVAIALRKAGVVVAKARKDSLNIVRKAAEGGDLTADEVSERTGLTVASVYSAARRLAQKGSPVTFRKTAEIKSKHAHVRAFVAANPDMGPKELAKRLGIPYQVAANARVLVRRRTGIPKIRRQKSDKVVAATEHVRRNPGQRPAEAAAELRVSVHTIHAIRAALRRDGGLDHRLVARIQTAKTRKLMAYMLAHPEQAPKEVAEANGVSADCVYYVRQVMRKAQPGSLPR